MNNTEQATKRNCFLRRLVLWGNTLLLIGMAVGLGVLCLGCGWSFIGGVDAPFTAFLVFPFLLCYLPARRRADMWVQVLTLAPLLLMVIINADAISKDSLDSETPLGWGIMQAVLAVATLSGHLLLRAALLLYRKWRNRAAEKEEIGR